MGNYVYAGAFPERATRGSRAKGSWAPICRISSDESRRAAAMPVSCGGKFASKASPKATKSSIRGFARLSAETRATLPPQGCLTYPYSAGPVEGQINRLTFIKRSMDGRGSFELLRQRVLLAA